MTDLDTLERELAADIRRAVGATIDANLRTGTDARTGTGTGTGAARRAGQPMSPSPRTARAIATRPSRHRRTALTLAAAALALVGAVGLLATRDRQSVRPLAPSSAPQTTVAPSGVVDAAPPDVVLPALPIAGYRLDHIAVYRATPHVPGGAEPAADTEDAGIAATPPSISLGLLREDGAPGQLVLFHATTAAPGTTLDTLAGQMSPEWEVERRVVGGVEVLLHTSSPDRFGTMVGVTWIVDGYEVSLDTRLPAEQALAIAETVAAVPFAAAQTVRAQVDGRFLAMSELDRITLPNGFELSVRGGGDGPAAVCLHEPASRCYSVASESSMSGEQSTAFATGVTVDGEPWIVGWATGTHQPVLVPQAPTASPVPVEIVGHGGTGTFVAIPISDEQVLFRFDADDTTMHSGGVSDDLLLADD